eukprot:CAMPEP_0204031232 /NCGR_PEP_ID=MMETSP0360-20130528/62213_1 /ASSEMBLY_ACC=CAM_ASM_000342 /TAXON_ID=268821 /ORGANISM="Scrippsiella Hangoei, Strain SHTV-5" /LENGTH=152 /DNA_ID=CAMNT_0050975433 /DNA_START=1 /DNA_END=455 /DNA_ORIENTATION=-
MSVGGSSKEATAAATKKLFNPADSRVQKPQVAATALARATPAAAPAVPVAATAAAAAATAAAVPAPAESATSSERAAAPAAFAAASPAHAEAPKAPAVEAVKPKSAGGAAAQSDLSHIFGAVDAHKDLGAVSGAGAKPKMSVGGSSKEATAA